MLSRVQTSIGLKLFLSYILVILIGIVVLSFAAELTIPRAFDRHMAGMSSLMGPGMQMGPGMNMFGDFRSAVNEALLLGALASSVGAGLAAVLVSRRMVKPIEQMTEASQRIAEGKYAERVELSGRDMESPEDMDELARLAVSFNRMADKLERTEEMRRQLIGDVAHELRTPLSTVKGSMEGLIDGVLPATQETFRKLHREADRMQRLVQDLQELSRVEAGAYELDMASADISVIIRSSLERLSSQYREKGVALSVSTPDNLPLVEVDGSRIEQVLLNLVGNALQYTPAGGSVRVSAAEEGDELVVRVADTGIGVRREDLNRVFSRFYRVDKSRSRAGGGSGIGLTIAKHIVERHGGRIWAESGGSGEGSTFSFAIPTS